MFAATAGGAAITAPLWAFDTPERSSVTLCAVPFERLVNSTSSRSYILIHGNELTAREVLRRHMQTARGKAHLVTGQERNVKIQGLVIDPNRMFSRVGAEKSLKRLNPKAGDAKIAKTLDWLDKHRVEIFTAVLPQQGGLLVAMHNNSQGYSLEEEIAVSDSVSLPRRAEPHEFMLTTSQEDFEILAKSPFNVVLQKAVIEGDDGSLSRFCASKRIRYVNIEAHLGKVDEQTAMLTWLEEQLP